jgi:hypothetical protein
MMHDQTAKFLKSAAEGPRPPTLSYAMAVLSVAVAIIAAELITRLLHAEPIALSMLCAVGDHTRSFGFPLLPRAPNQFIYLEA